MKIKISFVFFSLFLFSGLLYAQQEPLSFHGNARFAYFSTSGDALDHLEGTSFLRLRLGATYAFNETHSFRGRLATTQSQDLPAVNFTIKPDGSGLNTGSISFDEFFYRYSNESTELKIGRFQYSAPVLSNAKRSIYKFQSNNINIHWTDGLYLKKSLNEDWFGEFVGEYQNRDNTSYAYGSKLNFRNHEHNVAAYLGAENRSRDDNNFIQKGVGMFYAPDAYFTSDGYSFYLAFMGRLVYDLPQPEALQGGSFRIAGEAGQNLNANFGDGSILNISFGVNNFADKHELMIEFTKTDSEWLTANVYSPNSDELEIRYRYFFDNQFNIDFRYRIRESRNDLIPTNYNFFARATYSF